MPFSVEWIPLIGKLARGAATLARIKPERR